MEGSTDKPKKFPYDYSIIAPLWHDFDGATVYQREIPLPTSPSEKVRSQDQQDLDVSSGLVFEQSLQDFTILLSAITQTGALVKTFNKSNTINIRGKL